MPRPVRVLIVMGVSGCGKSTVGRLLATELNWSFFDGDDFHPSDNIAKMRAGRPLTDADRDPWLASLRALIDGLLASGEAAVIACSALKQAYRDRLSSSPAVRYVYLKGDRALLQDRVRQRTGHFMSEGLLASQLATLEEPADAMVADITEPPKTIVEKIKQHLREDGVGLSSGE